MGLTAALQHADVEMSSKQVKKVLKKYDEDQSGRIEFSEFRKLVVKYDQLKRKIEDKNRALEELHKVFDKHDVDQSGAISAEELHLALFEVGLDIKSNKVA